MTLHQDIEIGQRGYAITGDTAFLEPYRIAEAQVEGQLNAVARTNEQDRLNAACCAAQAGVP